MAIRKQRPLRRPLRLRLLAGPIRVPPVLITLLAGILLAWVAVSILEARMQPILAAEARTQVHNMVVSVVEEAVSEDLAQREDGYAQLISIQRDSEGAITALSTDMAQLNLLRNQLTKRILDALDGIHVSEIRIPLGVLLDSDLVWGRGPAICARALSVGTVSAEFDSRFTDAGVNQTLHRVWLEVSIPITVLLPGGPVEVPVETEVCVAETVLVGQVPDTFLQPEKTG